MSHLHIPDGIVPLPWVIISFVMAVMVVGIAIMFIQRGGQGYRKVPLVGIMSALMLVAMSIPLGFLPFHLNLAVLAGIVLGPSLGIIAVAAVNIILALMGHGGITVLGLNVLLMGLEVVAGYYLYTLLRRIVVPGWSTMLATVLALLLSATVMVAVVGLIQVNPEFALHHHEKENVELHQAAYNSSEIGQDHQERLPLTRFATLVMPVALGGAMVEGLVSGLIVNYLRRVRPDLIP